MCSWGTTASAKGPLAAQRLACLPISKEAMLGAMLSVPRGVRVGPGGPQEDITFPVRLTGALR